MNPLNKRLNKVTSSTQEKLEVSNPPFPATPLSVDGLRWRLLHRKSIPGTWNKLIKFTERRSANCRCLTLFLATGIDFRAPLKLLKS